MDIKIKFFILSLVAALCHSQRVELVCDVTEMSFGDMTNLPTCIIAGDFKILTQNTHIFVRDLQKLSKIRGLVAKNKEILYLPPGNEHHVWYTKAAVITDSKLRKITSDNLMSFKHLEYLDMSHNEIDILGPNLFQFNPNLRTLILDGNKIQIIDSTIFKEMPSLVYLGLNDNGCISKVTDNCNEILDATEFIGTDCWDEKLEMLKESMENQCKVNY
ncbi:leucine-rich alpha-2-glycoprotein-like [Chironomus tepperi]|uniref:leucine-rich alpha-2-glycoprotein-like n=1 Tax=Chironomus tepperi TaxID=113505 RepID=UPI00391F6A2E